MLLVTTCVCLRGGIRMMNCRKLCVTSFESLVLCSCLVSVLGLPVMTIGVSLSLTTWKLLVTEWKVKLARAGEGRIPSCERTLPVLSLPWFSRRC